MFDLDRWQEIAHTMRKNRLRTLLTALGVFWGMFMLLTMLGFGEGLQKGVERNFSDNATNAVYLWGQRTTRPYRGRQPGRRVGFDNGDVAAVAEIPGIAHLAPRNQLGGYRDATNVVRGGKTGSFAVMGDMPAYQHIQPLRFLDGRWINELDVEQLRKVVVIGRQVRDELYGDVDPIGTWLQVHGVYFQVVGLFDSPRADDQGDREASTIHLPFSTFQRVFNFGDRVGWITVVGRPEISGSALEADIRAVLADRNGVHPEDSQGIGSYNAEEEFGRIQALFFGIEAFVWFVGLMTLLSGVVGVSNIMLIVVRERTSEIGLRRALGATPLAVVSLVLQEAVVLTSLAGYSGVVAAVVLLEATAALVGPDNDVLGAPGIDFTVALGAAVILIISGLLAGLVPAQRAASIHPVEALRAQ